MSISTIRETDNYEAIYGFRPFVFDSTNKKEQDFKYIFEVSGSTYDFDFEVPPYPENGYGKLNLQNILKANVGIKKPERVDVQDLNNHLVDYYLSVGERYIDSNGNTVKNKALKTFNKTAVNAVRNYAGNYDYTNYRWLTKRKDIESKTNYFVKGHPYLLPYRVPSDLDTIDYLDSNGNVQSTKTFSNLSQHDLILIDAENFNSNNYDNFTLQLNFTSGIALPIDFDSVDCIDNRVKPLTLVWLNKLGGYDSFTFTLNHTINRNISRQQYKKKPNTLNSSNPAYEEKGTDRGFKDFGNISEQVLTLNSNWVTNKEFEWIVDVFDSPEVYLYDGSDYYAVVVTNDEVQEKINSKLFNIQLEVKYSNNNITQRI